MKQNIVHLLIMVASVLLFSSCLKDYKTEHKYNLAATFEYSDTKFDEDSLLFTTNKTGGFAFADLGFFHKLNADDTKVEGGFLLSSKRARPSVPDTLSADIYRMYSAKKEVANTYTVFKQNSNPTLMPKEHIVFLNKDLGTCSPIGCYIANSEAVVAQIKEHFTDGDSLTVVAKGYYNNQPTVKLRKNLAKFSAAKDSIVSTWTPFELDKLGNVDRIDFEVLSTKEGVDKVFCMDNMVMAIHLLY